MDKKPGKNRQNNDPAVSVRGKGRDPNPITDLLIRATSVIRGQMLKRRCTGILNDEVGVGGLEANKYALYVVINSY